MPDAKLCTLEEEAVQLSRFFADDKKGALALVERQLNAIHMRAQVVIGFAAVAVTTTGFSGRLIAGTNTVAQVCIITGLVLILASCLSIFLRVLAVEWVISRCLDDSLEKTLLRVLTSRNRKTRAYRLGSAGVFIGLTVYAVAIAIMLLNPEPLTVPNR
ncbi:MAG: hypothetical protein SynsKO_29140 [Synoicihabitans sp.]